jgi:hypothetical protein
MIMVSRWTGIEARALREAWRMSVRAFAAHLGVATASITNWERRRASIRLRDETQHILDAALHRAPDDVRARFEAAVLPDRQLVLTGDDTRIKPVVAHPRRTDPSAVAYLREQIETLDADYQRVPSAALLGAAGQLHGELALMAETSATGPIDREVTLSLAESATLMGQLVWDVSLRRDHDAANAYFDLAFKAAECAGAPLVGARALLRRSFVALYGQKDPVAGQLLAQQAATASGATSDNLTGLALLHVAEAHAMLRRRHECEASLASAERCLGSGDTSAGELVAPTDLGRMAGSCYLFLGDASRAVRYLSNALADFNQPTKAAAVTAANLALAYADLGQADEAVVSLHQSIDIVEATRGGAGLNVAFAAGRRLRPWRGTAAVDEVHDRLLSLMAG